MKHLARCAVLLAVLCATGLQAQTLRWASAGDPQTMDPHSQNEGLTNLSNGQVYERLTTRDKQLNLIPGLATQWEQVSPLKWRFKLRPQVQFHDGTPFTADDVVFSMERARQPTSQLAAYANAVGTPRAVDPLTVEFDLSKPNPIFLQHIDQLWILSRAWSVKNKTTRPLDFKNKEESFASFNANGTGPFMLVSRQPSVKTVWKRNPRWWGQAAGLFDGNVRDVVFNQISNDATRLAALVSGEVDFVLDPAPRDIARLRNTAGVKIIEGPENRIVFIGMDQSRDKLLYGRVAGDKNPFKDLRVRQAMYHAVDIQTIRTKLMNNQSVPTGGVTPSALGAFNDPTLDTRLPYDVARGKALMAEAGYAQGFEVTLDCPNNRYINDEEICIALAAMWSQIGIRIKVNAMPRATYFPKLEKLDTSLYMLGWGGAITDAETTFTPVLRNRSGQGVGDWNYGNVKNDKFDQLAAQSSVEPDPAKRETLIKSALREYTQQVHVIPLHRQVIPWAARSTLSAVHRPDNWFEWKWVKLAP